MRILAITQSKEIIGGANRSLLDVLQCLSDTYGHDVSVITPGEGGFTDALNKIGLRYKCFNYCQTSAMTFGNWKDPVSYMLTIYECMKNNLSAVRAAKTLSKDKYDIVYINDTTNTFGYYLAHRLKLPFVWHFRGYNSSIHRYMPISDEKKLRKDNRGLIIAISQAMKEFMVNTRKLNSDNITVIYNGVTNPGITIKQPWSSSFTHDMHCLQCGHLSKAKGQVDSIRAVGELKKRGYNNIYLHFAGTSAISHGRSYKEYLDELIKQENIVENVIYEGEVKDMTQIREHMQVELMCSIAEPFGRVTVEGMQAGLVTIGCDTGATPEIIEDNVNGMIYHQGDPNSLADCIEKVFLNRGLGDKLSNAALHFAESHFTMSNNVRGINAVLTSVMDRRNELS